MKQKLVSMTCLLLFFVAILSSTDVAAQVTVNPLFHSTNVKCENTRQIYFYGTVYDGLTPLSGKSISISMTTLAANWVITDTDANGNYYFLYTPPDGYGVDDILYVWVMGNSTAETNSDIVTFHIDWSPSPDPSYPYCAAARADFNSKYVFYFPLVKR